MLDLAGYSADRDLSSIEILEPSCGDGEFVVEIAKRLWNSSQKYGFDFATAFNSNVLAYDIDNNKIDICKSRLNMEYGRYGLYLDKNIRNADFLTECTPQADIIVGNPPYVRYEQIPQEQLSHYKLLFQTLHYRADLYIPFFEKTLKSLKRNGSHCFICANRWMKNEYGRKLRGLISSQFRLEAIISLEKAHDVFKEDVLAYPAITLIKNASPVEKFNFSEASSVHRLNEIHWKSLPSPTTSEWSTIFNKTDGNGALASIEDMGFKLGVGVATGADSIFIAKELPNKVENELLLPALNARDISGDHLQWSGKYLLNPYMPNGELISLDKYPKAAEYLLSHENTLKNRHVARKNPRKWYKTIDRIVPSLKNTPKILLPDISGNQFIFVDEGRFYPQHNLYYITGGNVRQLQLLSAVLMSSYVRHQLSNLSNCMNGGYPRWQSQYLRKLRLPDIRSLDSRLSDKLLTAYQKFDLISLNEAVETIISSPRPTERSKQVHIKQLELEFAD